MELLSLNKSYFELQRLHYRPETLSFLQTLPCLRIVDSPLSSSPSTLHSVLPHLCTLPEVSLQLGPRNTFPPLRIGVVLAGGQAPGGHNVVIGLFEGLRALNPNSRLFGFIQGPLGLTRGLYKHLDISVIYDYYNVGGFDMLSSSREKIKTKGQKNAILKTVKQLKLDGLLIIGGNNSNTDTAMLADYFLEHHCHVPVIGVPKTIDGDLKNQWIETSLGFHTSCRIYSEMIGNLGKDVLSTKKYHHFIRLMGNRSSYTSLECGLQTLPNITLISEVVAQHIFSINQLAISIAQQLIRRYKTGKNYSLVLIPEGILGHIQDTKTLIQELNTLSTSIHLKPDLLHKKLSQQSLSALLSLPKEIQKQLLTFRDSYGNIRMSQITTEDLLSQLVDQYIRQHAPSMDFQPVSHFFGYESRAAFPSNFDANYGLALGIFSALFLAWKRTGYMITIQNLAQHYSQWIGGGVPLSKMMGVKEHQDEKIPIINIEDIHPESRPLSYLKAKQEVCLMEDAYRFPGPLQYYQETTKADQRPLILLKEYENR